MPGMGGQYHRNIQELTIQSKMWISSTEEVRGLIEWMRSYNADKPASEQLGFYGIDIQDASESAKRVTDIIKKHPTENQDEYLKILDQYTSAVKSNKLKTDELKEHLNKMAELKTEIENSDTTHHKRYIDLQNSIIQSINYKLNFNQKTRDKAMAENVKAILEKSGKNSKVFVWAHNGHIGKDKITNTNIPSMGHILREWYGNQYYSLGFDFATGTFNAFNLKEKKVKEASVTTPFKNTRGELFSKSSLGNFYLDFKSSSNVGVINDYLNRKTTYRVIGSVYNSKMIGSQKLIDTYDGIIFVKNTSTTELLKN